MGLVSALAQCALDFLIDERCHGCGSALARARGPVPAPPLAAPVDVLARFGFRLRSRLFCPPCAARVLPWSERVVLAHPGSDRPGDTLHLYPAFVTDERLLTVIHLLKFGRRECLAPWLARAMMSGLPAAAPAPPFAWRVIPVPMDRRARSRRGFNQAESLARCLSAAWQLPMSPARALVKVRRTRPQSALDRAQRLANLANAFRADEAEVGGARVIVVDDLVTTGATVSACARALCAAGALEVRVVCAGYRDQAPARASPFLQS